jgi:hypothetical protein
MPMMSVATAGRADPSTTARTSGSPRSSAALHRPGSRTALDRDVRRARRLDHEVALVELRHELAPSVVANSRPRPPAPPPRAPRPPRPADRAARSARTRDRRPHQPRRPRVGTSRGRSQARRRRDERERQHQRRRQREHHREPPSAGTSSRRPRSAPGSGTYTSRITRTEKNTGRRDPAGPSSAATFGRRRAPVGRPRGWFANVEHASTITTAPSTSSPKSIAPRLIRFPGCRAPPCRQRASIDSGIASATSSPARRLPSIANSTATTRSRPRAGSCDRAQRRHHELAAVVDHVDRHVLRQRRAITSGMRACTPCITSQRVRAAEHLHHHVDVSPAPSAVAAPIRGNAPVRTSATSEAHAAAPRAAAPRSRRPARPARAAAPPRAASTWRLPIRQARARRRRSRARPRTPEL